MKRTGITILFTLLLAIGFSQNTKIDSLRKALANAKEDTAKVITINMLATLELNIGDFEPAMANADEAQLLAEKLGYKHGAAKALNIKGNICNNEGNYSKALEYHFKALKIREEIHDKVGMSGSLNNIGNNLNAKGDQEEALIYFFKALKMMQETGNKNWEANTLINIGAIYQEKRNTALSLQYYFKALPILEEIGDGARISTLMGNLGTLYIIEKNFKQAFLFLNKGLKIAEEVGDEYDIAMRWGDLAYAYLRIKDYQKALFYFEKAEHVASRLGALILESYYLEGLSEVYEATGKYKEALVYYVKHTQISDSINSEENTKKIVQAKMNYEFEKKVSGIEQNHLFEIEKQKSKRNMYIAGSSILMVIGVFVFNRSRLKQKHKYQQELNKQQKEQATAVMETQEQERKRIAEDLHDSLGHLLSTVKINLQTVPDEQKQLFKNSLDLLTQASSEIHNISFNLMPQTLEEEGLIAALHELADKVRKTGSVNILLQVHGMEKVVMEKQTQFSLYRIIQEVINNILKHAQASEINIQFIKQDDHITVMIEDDGKGFNPEEVKKNGRGLKNINTRSAWLNGTASIDSTPGRGTTVTIEAPLYN